MKNLDRIRKQLSPARRRTDLLISTLRGYVEALGGRLSLVAEFPDKDPAVLGGLASLTDAPTKIARR